MASRIARTRAIAWTGDTWPKATATRERQLAKSRDLEK
jgi:hypothetical protein